MNFVLEYIEQFKAFLLNMDLNNQYFVCLVGLILFDILICVNISLFRLKKI